MYNACRRQRPASLRCAGRNLGFLRRLASEPLVRGGTFAAKGQLWSANQPGDVLHVLRRITGVSAYGYGPVNLRAAKGRRSPLILFSFTMRFTARWIFLRSCLNFSKSASAARSLSPAADGWGRQSGFNNFRSVSDAHILIS